MHPSNPPACNEIDPDTSRHPTPSSLVLSTILSLMVVLVLLVVLRLMLPSMLEMSRYSWHRGQLRAEYEIAGEQLERVSLDGLTVSQSVARRVFPSVVHITLDTESDTAGPDDATIRRNLRRSMVGQGSGVVVDKDGHILTNYHVLNDEENQTGVKGKVNVLLADERTCTATLLGFDAARDLAILKIDATDLMPTSPIMNSSRSLLESAADITFSRSFLRRAISWIPSTIVTDTSQQQQCAKTETIFPERFNA
jgi:S1-C subfamily serine protease